MVELPCYLYQTATTADDRQLLRIENLACLILRVLRPWTDRIEPYVGEPVPQRPTTLSLPLIREREIVVGIGILRDKRNGLLVGGGCLSEALHLIEHIAEVKEGERVLGVGKGSPSIVLLGQFVATKVVVDRP